MVQYWPMAITESGEKLFTYDSVDSEEKCIKQFDIWERHYNYRIKEAWIDCCYTFRGSLRRTRKRFKKEWVGEKDYSTLKAYVDSPFRNPS